MKKPNTYRQYRTTAYLPDANDGGYYKVVTGTWFSSFMSAHYDTVKLFATKCVDNARHAREGTTDYRGLMDNVLIIYDAHLGPGATPRAASERLIQIDWKVGGVR